MNAVGVIVEYNPLHNGHVYHLQEARRLSGADAVVAVMSGPFLQRGEPAIVGKGHAPRWRCTQARISCLNCRLRTRSNRPSGLPSVRSRCCTAPALWTRSALAASPATWTACSALRACWLWSPQGCARTSRAACGKAPATPPRTQARRRRWRPAASMFTTPLHCWSSPTIRLGCTT